MSLRDFSFVKTDDPDSPMPIHPGAPHSPQVQVFVSDDFVLELAAKSLEPFYSSFLLVFSHRR